jgi:glycosyltransferase involved in cell wall biosynthesis/GT2 family glycosyltransferase
MSQSPLASVIIPTRNRRDSLERALRALARQTLPARDFEVIVSIDASSDGTREMVAGLPVEPALLTVSAETRGRAAACNAGARAARGALLVLLDDDMEPGPGFLAAHLSAHSPSSRRGVVGAAPVQLGPSSPPVVDYIGSKFNRHLEKLSRPGYRMTFRDFYSGNFSIAKELFLQVGGFDEDFRIYGNEDGDLALRLLGAGAQLHYCEGASAEQHYEKDFAALAQDNLAKGRTAVLLSRKWPEALAQLPFSRRGNVSRKWAFARESLLELSRVVPGVPGLIVRAVEFLERRPSPRMHAYHRFALDYFYRLGARRALAGNHGALRYRSSLGRGSRPRSTPRKVIQYTDSTGYGGAEKMLLTLLEGLDRRLWSPVLMHHESPGVAPLLEEARRLRVPTRALAATAGRRGLSVGRDLSKAIREESPDVFHAHLCWTLRCSSGLAAAAMASVPAVVATQQLFSEIHGIRDVLRQRVIAAGVDRYIAVSSNLARRLASTPLFPERKIRIIPNAVRAEIFALARTETRASRADRRPVVLTLARLDRQKGLPVLLEAASRIPEARFLIAGEGPERPALEAEIRRLDLGGRVTLLGHRDDAPRLLADCDLFVLPSLHEGLPVSVLEAMAAGRPVVATAIGGTNQAVVDGETGLLVAAGDAEALAMKIREVLADPDLAHRLGEAGRRRVAREFSAESMVRQVMNLYEELLAA